MITFAAVDEALSRLLAVGLAPTLVELNREVPTDLPEPTDDRPTVEYVVVRTGPFERNEQGTFNKRGWLYKPGVELYVSTKSPDQVGTALFALLERVDALISGDRRLGFPQGSGVGAARVMGGVPDALDSPGSGPGGNLALEVHVELQTSNVRLSAVG